MKQKKKNRDLTTFAFSFCVLGVLVSLGMGIWEVIEKKQVEKQQAESSEKPKPAF